MNEAQIFEQIQAWATQLGSWFNTHVLTISSAVQLVVIGIASLVGALVGRRIAARLRQWLATMPGQDGLLMRFAQSIVSCGSGLGALLLLLIAEAVMRGSGQGGAIIHLAFSLLAAFVVIRITTRLVEDRFWARLVAWTAWIIAALSITGLLDPATAFMDSLAIDLGGIRLSLLIVVKGGIILFLLLKGATTLSMLVQRQIEQTQGLSPSLQVLITKVVKISLLGVAVLVALKSVGVDLTGFAVLGGAVGVGLGFGLQKVVSNLVSGVILLLDNSIKPGDVIELEGVYGWVTAMNARYTTVVTRDATEYLIPNEDLITGRVVNWSFSDRRVRQKVSVGVAYSSDLHLVMDLLAEAAKETKRVLNDPAPVARLMSFGDSSVDLQLRYWIDDPEGGVANVRSEVMLRIWDKFAQNGVEIPFPQREVRVLNLREE